MSLRFTNGVLDDRCQDVPSRESPISTKPLQDAAGLEPEQFPIHVFIGMISDEIESLRKRGKTDDEITSIIRGNRTIDIGAAEIAENYASPEDRHHQGE